MNIIIVLKLYLRVNLGQDPRHKSGWPLTWINVMIKVIIIIILKFNLGADL